MSKHKNAIEVRNGKPQILIEGGAYAPMAFATLGPTTYLEDGYLRRLGEAGIGLFFIHCNLPWLDDPRLDTASLAHNLSRLRREVPGAKALLRLNLHPVWSKYSSVPHFKARNAGHGSSSTSKSQLPPRYRRSSDGATLEHPPEQARSCSSLVLVSDGEGGLECPDSALDAASQVSHHVQNCLLFPSGGRFHPGVFLCLLGLSLLFRLRGCSGSPLRGLTGRDDAQSCEGH